MILTSSSLRACHAQLLIDHHYSALLEYTLQFSLSTQFGNATLLHGKSDIPQSIQLKLWRKPFKHL